MLFNSYEFLFAFLPISLIGYRLFAGGFFEGYLFAVVGPLYFILFLYFVSGQMYASQLKTERGK